MTDQIDRVVEAIAGGMFHESMKTKLGNLEARRNELEAMIADAFDENPVLLHPGLPDRYREEVSLLTETLNAETTKAEAMTIIRSLLLDIRMIPDDDALSVELVGELAGILALGAP
ncbi:recombinase family protein, partial [Roseivivax sp. GX 12232]|nr:recombinase family protein [Roseivivax sp. GX 12232]